MYSVREIRILATEQTAPTAEITEYSKKIIIIDLKREYSM